MKEGILWKALSRFILPLRGIALILFSLCFVYVLTLKLNFPQHFLNAYLKQTLPSNVTITVGKISKAFPFAFHIDTVVITLSDGKSAKIRSIDVRLRGRQISSMVEEISLISNMKEEEERDLPQTALRTYEALCEHLPKIAFLKYVDTLKVRSIHGTTTKEKASLCVYTLAGIKCLTVQKKVNDGIYHASLKIGKGIDYEICGQKKGNSLWICEGKLELNAKVCQIIGRVSKRTEEERAEVGTFDLSIFHSRIPALFKEETTLDTLVSGTLSYQEWLAHLKGMTNRTVACEVVSKKAPHVCLARVDVAQNTKGIALNVVHEAPQSQLSFRGDITEKEGHLKLSIQNIRGKWKTHTIAIPSLQYDVQTKQLDLSTITLDQTPIQATRFSFDSIIEAPNTLTFPAKDLISSDQMLDFGRFTVAARAIQPRTKDEGDDPRLVVSFALQSHKHRAKALTQMLGLDVRGDVVLSRHGISVQNIILESGQGAHCEGELTLYASSLLDLLAGIRQTFRINAAAKEEADVRSRIRLSGHLHGTLSLVPISITLTTGDRISGKVTTDLQLDGTLAHPLITGPFTLERGYYENVSNGIVLKNVSLQATGDGDQMVIHEIRLTDGTSVARRSGDSTGKRMFPIAQPPQGFASGHGSLRFWTSEEALWAPWLTVCLRLNTMQVTYSKLVKGRASGDVVLEGSLLGRSDRPVVTGEVTIDGMLLTIETTQALPTSSEQWRVTEQRSKTGPLFDTGEKKQAPLEKSVTELSTADPVYRQFALDVTLKGDHILVQDEALHCFLKGTMIARGPLPNPHLIGTMRVDLNKPATYDFLGKRLSIIYGTVIYDEKIINDPIVDITLKITLNGKDLFVTLSGRLSHVNIGLRANPAMSNEEILSLLLFGQGIDALSANQNVQVKAFASQMLQGNGNPLGFLDHLRGKLKLDSLEILETQNLESGETTQSVRLGKSLKKTHIYFGQDLSSKSNTKVTLRYDLTPEIGLEANLSTLREASGVGIQWLRRY